MIFCQACDVCFSIQTVSTASELRKPVYRTVAAMSIDYDSLLQQMAVVKWDIKELMSQHSQYVDVLLQVRIKSLLWQVKIGDLLLALFASFVHKSFYVQELDNLNDSLAAVSKKCPIPKEVTDVLWEHCIRLSNRTFVEG